MCRSEQPCLAAGPYARRVITQKPGRDVRAVLDAAGLATTTTDYSRGDTVYIQGHPADCVMYILDGAIKLSVMSLDGEEAVVGKLGPGDFFGEGSLTDQPIRSGSATATAASRVLAIPKAGMLALLHQQHDLSDRFITHMLSRNISLETGLIDQLFNSNKTRPVRADSPSPSES